MSKKNTQDKSTATLEPTSEAAPEGRNLDKIRDILFGNQAKEFEQRMQRLEERVLQECENMRQESQRRLEVLETFAKKELAAQTERLRAESAAREELGTEQAAQAKETAKGVSKKIAHLAEQLDAVQRELREEILSQAKNMLDEQRRSADGLSSSLARETGALREGKLDRLEIASLFNELAMRLNGAEE